MTEQVLDAPPAGDAPPPPRPRIHPRFRQRWIEVKRQAGRRRLRVLVAVAVVVAVAIAGLGLARSPLLRVRHVRVIGAVHTPVLTIERAAGLAGYRTMFAVDRRRDEAALRRLPWVGGARVTRQWPSTVVVTITERLPVAVMGPTTAQVEVDATGRVLGPAPIGTPLPLVITDGDPIAGKVPQPDSLPGPVAAADGTGPTPVTVPAPPPKLPPGPTPPAPGATVAPTFRPGLQVAGAMTAGLSPRILAVVVTAAGTVDLKLFGGAWALLGTPDQLGEKLQAVQTLLDSAKVGKGVINVTVASAPVVTGAP